MLCASTKKQALIAENGMLVARSRMLTTRSRMKVARNGMLTTRSRMLAARNGMLAARNRMQTARSHSRVRRFLPSSAPFSPTFIVLKLYTEDFWAVILRKSSRA